MAERTLKQRQAIAIATAKANAGGGGQQQQSGIADVVRPAEFAARGFTENALQAVGAIPELVSGGMRSVGFPAPESGYYQQALKEGAQYIGQTVSEPFNRALGFIDAGGNPTGQFGSSEPVGTLERGAMGAGRGIADVGAFMAPGGMASKLGGITGKIGKTMLAQPGIQVAAGIAGGATTELTDNPWIGLATAIGTGVSASSVLNKIAVHGATTLGEKKILSLITKLGDGDTAKGMQIAQQRMKQGGRDTALVDVTGIKGEKLARASANVPQGEGASIADEFVGARMAGRGERYQEAADVFGPWRNMPVLEEKMKAAQQMAAGPYYEQAFAANPTVISKEIDLILKTPNGRKALKNAVDMMQNDRSLVGKINPETTQRLKDAVELGKMPDVKGGVADGLNMRTLDYVKRALGDIEGAAIRGGEGSRAGIVGGQRRALTTEIDAADVTAGKDGIGDYAKARAEYAAIAGEKDALEVGKKFMRGDADVTELAISRMPQAEQEAARMGARKALGDLIRQDRQAVATRLADKKDAIWDRIRAVFQKDEVANFKRFIEIENKKMSVERFVGPRTGSPTAGIQQDVAELGRQLPDSAVAGLEAGGQLLSGHWIRALGVVARPFTDYIKRPSAKTAETLAGALLETNPKLQKTMLDALIAKSNSVPKIDVRMIQSLIGKTTTAQELGDIAPNNKMQQALGGR